MALLVGSSVVALACFKEQREWGVTAVTTEAGTFSASVPPSGASIPPSSSDPAPRRESTIDDAAKDSSSGAPSTAIAPEPGHADLDPDNDLVVGPPAAVPDCEARLRAAGIQFRRASLRIKIMDRGAWSCGAEQVVEYRGSASAIRYSAPPLLTCTMVLGLAQFERILQEEAAALFQSSVARIQHGGTYNCRRMARFDMVSEHSFANAIDLLRLTLANGVTIDVVRHFGKRDEEPTSRESQFLRRTARRAYDEDLFSVVLTPLFDPLHRDHFHLDMARYRVDGAR